MNKQLTVHLVNHNKWMFCLTALLMGLMFFKNIFINIIACLCIGVIAIRQTFYFLPLRFDDVLEDDYTYTIYKLIPIKNNTLNLYNLMNSILWSMVIFITIELNIPAFKNINYNLLFYIKIILTCLIPLLLAIVDNYISKSSRSSFTLFSLLTGISILYIPINYDKDAIYINIIFIVLCFLGIASLFINLFDFKYKKWQENMEFGLNSNNRLVAINNTTNYYLNNKKNYIDYGFNGWCIYWIIQVDPLLNVISIFIINLGVINSMLKKYYYSNNLIRLLPISIKEKKLSCNLFTIIRLLITNILISSVFYIKSSFDFDGLISGIVILSSLSILAYSLVITFFHRKDDLFIAIMAFTAFICLSYGFYHFYNQFKLYTTLPILLISIILMIIDYFQNKTSC